MNHILDNQRVLVTGGARRIGRAISLAIAQAGGTVVIHSASSIEAGRMLVHEIESTGGMAEAIQADFHEPDQVSRMMDKVLETGPLDGLVNNASIFEPLGLYETNLTDWENHLTVNLTAPFLLSQKFASARQGRPGRIVNLLDWRALRPGADHFPYTISKSALAALTKSLAVALAPHIQVNGLALGAILPPSTGAQTSKILETVPAGRWAELSEVTRVLLFLLSGPSYITGEIIHVDGGRHLI